MRSMVEGSRGPTAVSFDSPPVSGAAAPPPPSAVPLPIRFANREETGLTAG